MTDHWTQRDTGDEQARRVLYLDIDGTVRQGKGDALGKFVNGPEDVIVFPEAVERMTEWRDAGGLIVGVTNQGGVGLGIIPYEQMAAALVETNRQTGGLFDHIHVCIHHPRAENPEMARCWCRKPSAGAIAEAVYGLAERRYADGHREYYPPHLGLMVGDMDSDRECAESARLDFMHAVEWRRDGASYDGSDDD